MASYDDTATVSGSVVSIENGADEVGAKSCVVTVRPTLSGVSSVTETQTGRNLFDNTGLFPVSGSVSSYYFKQFDVSSGLIPEIHLKEGVTYTFAVDATSTIEPFNFSVGCGNGSYSSDILSVYNKSSGRISITFTPTAAQLNNGDIFAFRCPRYQAQNTFDYSISNAQIEYGSTAHTYEPYQTPTQYTASLGRTIYGGTADLVTGEGTSLYAKLSLAVADMNNLENYPGWKNSGVREIVGSGINTAITDGVTTVGQYYNINTNGATNDIIFLPPTRYNNMSQTDWKTQYPDLIIEILVEIPTPTDFTFTGQEIPTRLGYNAFWSEQGDTELTYYKSGYGFTSVTVHKETPEGEPVEQTAYLHKVIYGGQADVVKGTCDPKNLIELYTRASHNGVNYSINADGSLHREGTASPSTSYNNGNATTYSACPYKLSKGTYTITVRGNQASGGYLSLGMRKTDNTQLTSISVTGNTSNTFTVDEDVGAWYWISLPNGVSTNDDVYVQLEKGSESTEHAPHFEPFSFPPISMSTDEGENTLFANEGDSAITYRKETD